MYRGSTFLLQHAYKVHIPVVETLGLPQFSALWETEVGAGPADPKLVTTIVELVDAVKEAYGPFARAARRQPVRGRARASDILATKVILGTMGSLPAVDRFFVAGFRKSHHSYSKLNRGFVEQVIKFCNERSQELRTEQARIEASSNVYYPLMKLADMYFWQVGYDASPPKARRKADQPE
jgi:hypothetical protein